MSLVTRLASNETLITAWSGVPDSITVELMAATPFDAVTLDMQHGGHHEDSVLRSIPLIHAAGKPALVRIPVGRFDFASRALDFGADAVIAPMINSVADAQAFADSMKYPPLGARSWGPTFAFPRYNQGTYADWLRDSNGRTLALAMIETRAALAVADDILDLPGIDGIFLGPSDFSIAWTEGKLVDSAHEDMMGAIADVAKKARGRGKVAAIYVIVPSLSRRVVDMGYQLLACGSEGQLLGLGASQLLGSVKSSLGSK